MISKGDLIRLTRVHLDLTQLELAKLIGSKRLETISAYERGVKKVTYQRLCQIYVVYCKLGTPCQQLDNIFNDYIEKMFKE